MPNKKIFIDGVLVSNDDYKVYTAVLTQTGTNDPIATVFQNTLGFLPTWERQSTGLYVIAETFEKTPLFIPFGGAAGAVNLPIGWDNAAFYSMYVQGTAPNLKATIGIVNNLTDFNSVELSSIGGAGQAELFVEIRVYP